MVRMQDGFSDTPLPTPTLDTLPVEIVAGGGAALLWVFFWFGFIVTAGFAFGLIYHWLRYGFMYPLSLIALPVYAVGALVFVGGMLAGIGSI